MSVETTIKTKVFFNTDEKKLMEDVGEFLLGIGKKQLSGFNIKNFDIPQLLYRFIKYNISTQSVFPFNKNKILDIRDIVTFFSFNEKGTLVEYLKEFGLEGKYNGLDGSKVQELWDKKDYDTIKKYSEKDAKIEMDLLLRVIKYYDVAFNPYDLLVFDIETIIDESKLPNVEDIKAEKMAQLSKKYKTEKTIKNHFETFMEDEIETGKYKEKYNLDKFTNQIVSVSFSWYEIK